ncbi:hypothetical protein ACFLXE_01395, partial [Chloroflexota bacterium]
SDGVEDDDLDIEESSGSDLDVGDGLMGSSDGVEEEVTPKKGKKTSVAPDELPAPKAKSKKAARRQRVSDDDLDMDESSDGDLDLDDGLTGPSDGVEEDDSDRIEEDE